LQAQGWAIIDGVTGAVIKQSGGIFGTFSHVAAGQLRVGLNMASIAETDSVTAVLMCATDNGGGASVTRTCGYGINPATTPPELNLYTRDSAGVLADCARLTVLVYTQL
jgi:hypothetical protein